MARCKLTRMNLRNIRKSREYQCLLIDFVKVGVVGKTTAESLLGYTIPAGLITDSNSVVTPEPEPEEDDDTEDIVTLVHFNDEANAGEGEWTEVSYTLTGNNDLENMRTLITDETDGYNIPETPIVVAENPDYEEGVSDRNTKYIELDPQPDPLSFTAGQILKF